MAWFCLCVNSEAAAAIAALSELSLRFWWYRSEGDEFATAYLER